jgi:hypothetical protein
MVTALIASFVRREALLIRVETSDHCWTSSCRRESCSEGGCLVVELAGLEAVEQGAEHAIEGVANALTCRSPTWRRWLQ